MGGFIIIVVEMGLNRGPGQPPGQQGDNLLQHGQERGDCGPVILYSPVYFCGNILSNYVQEQHIIIKGKYRT